MAKHQKEYWKYLNMKDKKISVLGLGYIGLPTAAVVASRGFNVVGVDVNEEAVNTINRGEIHIVEPELDVIVRSVVSVGKLVAKTKAEDADVFLIAVPTPFKEDKKPDLSYVEAATRSIAKVLKKGDLVILESTSPVGTTDLISTWISQERPDLKVADEDAEGSQVYLAHCPERVLPGHVLRELIENDRVIGGINKESGIKAKEFYESFVEGECILTDARTAEMAKLTENTFRDVNIAFANELSLVCDNLNIDVWELIQLANRHPRVNILQPGPGVGGHCLAVDPWFIVDSDPSNARLTKLARIVNDGKPEFIVNKVVESLNSGGQTIACFGAAFKPDIDDLRESPALLIIEKLAENAELEILVVEPNVETLPTSISNKANVRLVELSEAIDSADVGVVLVAHKQFRNIAELTNNKLKLISAVKI